MHGARDGAPAGQRNGNYRHGARSKELIGLWKLIKSNCRRWCAAGGTGAGCVKSPVNKSLSVERKEDYWTAAGLFGVLNNSLYRVCAGHSSAVPQRTTLEN
jgi:hypothetical protein